MMIFLAVWDLLSQYKVPLYKYSCRFDMSEAETAGKLHRFSFITIIKIDPILLGTSPK